MLDDEDVLAAAEIAEAEAPPARQLVSAQAGVRTYEVSEEDAGSRLDRYLALQSEVLGEALSRTRIRALLDEGKVSVDGKVATDAGVKARLGQTIAIEVPEPEAAEPEGENIPLDVVYEDEHLIVVNKPAGLVVHPAAGHERGTLVNALIAHCGESLSGIGGVRRPGIVHRLDKDTSGLLVVAKTDAAHQGLAALFADHGRTLPLTRAYKALVWGVPERPRGVVDAPVGRHATHREKQAIVRGERGREAVTHWAVEQTYVGKDGKVIAALVGCELETGRTHQIRVHMTHIGHPVMGDPVYAGGFRTKASHLPDAARAALDAMGRQALHAQTLGFEHPATGEFMSFERDPPADMQALIDALED